MTATDARRYVLAYDEEQRAYEAYMKAKCANDRAQKAHRDARLGLDADEHGVATYALNDGRGLTVLREPAGGLSLHIGPILAPAEAPFPVSDDGA